MNSPAAGDPTNALTIDEVDAELRRIVTQRNLLEDSSLETEQSLSAALVTINHTMDQLAKYPEELRRTILDHGRDIETSVFFHAQQEWTTARFNEYFTFKQALGKNSPTRLLDGLRYYPQLPTTEDYTTLDQTTQQQVHALLTVARKLGEEHYVRASTSLNGGRDAHALPLEYVGPYNGSNKLAGDDLISLVLSHSQHADKIAEIIIDRDTSDVTLIHDIITSSTPSLSNGTL